MTQCSSVIAPGRAVARALPRVVILQAAVDVVGIVHVDADRVDLADAHVREVVAGLAAVDRDVDAAVAAEDDAVLCRAGSHHIERKSPNTPRKKSRVPGLAAVARDVHRVAGHDDGLVVVRIDADLVERVRRLAAGDVDVGHLPPRLAAVVGAIELVADDAGGERADGADVARCRRPASGSGFRAARRGSSGFF